MAITQYILGVQPTYEGLIIDPCISSSMREYTVCRKFREAEYVIHVQNPNGVQRGIRSITIDGIPIEGNLIRESTGKHQVEIILG